LQEEVRMSFWELLALSSAVATIMGVFLTIYALINNKTLKEESKLTRETLQKLITEESRLTREMIERMTERTEKMIERMTERTEKMIERTTEKLGELIVSEGQKTRELIRKKE